MHRIDGPSATQQNQFTEGSPTGGVPATIVSDDWLNDVQENICRAIEAAGITLAKGDFTQLTQAIAGGQGASFLAALGDGGSAANDYVRLPFRDKTSGAKRFLTVNFGTALMNGASLSVTFSAAYIVACRYVGIIDAGMATRSYAGSPSGLGGATFNFSASANTTVFWLAVGV